MKRVLAVLLLAVIFVQSTSQLWISASFFLNRKYIAEFLCINRDKPEMACKGACQLKKRIEQDQEKQEHSDVKSKEVLVYLLNNPVILQSGLPQDQQKTTIPKSRFNSFLPEGYYHSVFHPPSSFV